MEQDDGQAMAALREVMRKGQGMYERSRTKASGRAYRKAKDVIQVSMGDSPEHMHPDFKSHSVVGHSDLVSSLERFRPAETVMEMGNKGKSIVGLMSERRKVMERKRKVPPTASEKQITEDLPESKSNTVSYISAAVARTHQSGKSSSQRFPRPVFLPPARKEPSRS